MPAYQYANNPQTVLSGGITAVATSITVASSAAFPARGKFTIIVDSEIMLVTGVAGSTFTVTRGAEGTAAVSHNNNAAVTAILTKGSLLDSQHVDVRTHGATGNGTTDDTTAVQAAITAAAGGRVFLPEGTYLLSAPLTLSSRVQIVGQGHLSVLKRANAFNGHMINAGNDVTDVTISDLTFDGNRANTSGGSYLVKAVRPLRWRIERARFINSPATAPGLALQGGDDNVVKGCHFEDVGYGVVIGLEPNSVDTCDRNIVMGNTFRDIDLNAVFITGSLDSTASTSTPHGNSIIGNTVYNFGDAALESGIGCRETIISGNTVRGGSSTGVTGILVRDNAGTVVEGNSVLDVDGANGDGIAVVSQITESTGIVIGPNAVRGCVRYGLFIQDAFRVAITGGDYSSNGTSGVVLSGVYEFTMTGVVAAHNGGTGFGIGQAGAPATSGIVNACMAYDNGESTANTFDGFVTLDASTANVHFADNMAFDTRAGGSRTQRYGLHIFQGATTLSVAGNKAFNNITAQIVDGVGVQGISFGNRAAATTLGSVTGRAELFDSDGTSQGFVPIYNTIT